MLTATVIDLTHLTQDMRRVLPAIGGSECDRDYGHAGVVPDGAPIEPDSEPEAKR